MVIKQIINKLNELDRNLGVKVSDGSYLTKEYGSDRGDYCNMYLGYTENQENKNIIKTIGELIEVLDEALKEGIMIGYKGGEYDINEYTVVTIGMYGCCGYYTSDIKVIDNIVYIVYEETITREVWCDDLINKIRIKE